MPVLVAALAALLLLDGGGGSAPGGTPPIAGCVEVPASELYVQYAYRCPDGTRVLMFASDEARDSYLRTAETFGSVTVERGPRWARTRD